MRLVLRRYIAQDGYGIPLQNNVALRASTSTEGDATNQLQTRWRACFCQLNRAFCCCSPTNVSAATLNVSEVSKVAVLRAVLLLACIVTCTPRTARNASRCRGFRAPPPTTGPAEVAQARRARSAPLCRRTGWAVRPRIIRQHCGALSNEGIQGAPRCTTVGRELTREGHVRLKFGANRLAKVGYRLATGGLTLAKVAQGPRTRQN